MIDPHNNKSPHNNTITTGRRSVWTPVLQPTGRSGQRLTVQVHGILQHCSVRGTGRCKTKPRAWQQSCSQTSPRSKLVVIDDPEAPTPSTADPDAGYLGTPFVENDDDDDAYDALVEEMAEYFN